MERRHERCVAPQSSQDGYGPHHCSEQDGQQNPRAAGGREGGSDRHDDGHEMQDPSEGSMELEFLRSVEQPKTDEEDLQDDGGHRRPGHDGVRVARSADHRMSLP